MIEMILEIDARFSEFEENVHKKAWATNEDRQDWRTTVETHETTNEFLETLRKLPG